MRNQQPEPRVSGPAAGEREGAATPGHHKAARARLQVLGLLTTTRWINAVEVQARLGEAGLDYGKRAVEKMLKSLCDEYPAIERDDTVKPYLYRWEPGARHPLNLELDDRESLTLLLAAAHLQHLLPAEVNHWMDGRFREARRRLDPVNGDKPWGSWLQKVAVVSQLPALLPPNIADGVYENVSQALLKDCWLNVDYRNSAGKLLSGRRVMPLALVQQSERLFLVCRFEEHQDIRHLALHRMLRAQATPHAFERPAQFSLKAYIDKSAFGFGRGEAMRLVLRVSPHLAALLEETPLAADQTVEMMADIPAATVRATVIRSEQIRWWIRMHGAAVQVITPADLLTEVDSAQPATVETQVL